MTALRSASLRRDAGGESPTPVAKHPTPFHHLFNDLSTAQRIQGPEAATEQKDFHVKTPNGSFIWRIPLLNRWVTVASTNWGDNGAFYTSQKHDA